MAAVTERQTTPTAQLPPELRAIVRQQEKVYKLRERVRDETRELAEMLAATRDHDDRGINPTAAARALGYTKGWAHELITKLEAGKL
jgi:hypothetical protein